MTESAKRAGFPPESANNTGSRLAKTSYIAARIEELRSASLLPPSASASVRNKDARLDSIDSRWRKANYIIDTRAMHPDYQTEPGANTGLLIKTIRVTRSKDSTSEETTFRLDSELLKELRELESCAAEELGQRVKHSESTTSKLSVALNSTDLHAMLQSNFGTLSDKEQRALLSALPDLTTVVDSTTVLGSSEPDTDADARQSGDDSAVGDQDASD